MNDPKFPQISSLSEEPKGSSFNDFFKKEEQQYVDNPFGKDFIKLEVDPARFGTNKTSKFKKRQNEFLTFFSIFIF